MLKKYGIDITDEVREALAELPVAPLKDEMITPMANRLIETAHELGYNWEKLDKFMFQDKWKSEYGFGYYGDSHGVKWSALNYVEEALVNGAVLMNEAKVKKVIIDGKKAVGVEFNMRGKSYTVTASKIVLAAGGIGTPVIMRNSGVKGVGYNYFFDPLITVCGKIKDIKKQSNEIPMSAGCHMEDEGYMMTDMALPFMLEKIFTSQVLHFHRLFESDHTIRVMIKAKDTLGGRLTDTGGVRKKLIKEDRQKLMKGYERAKKILEVAGATGIYKTWYLAAHPGGTVKIGEFLDSDLKTEYDNLYVCDCSVIPEPWGLPPIMTIIGLGKYLAKHLGSI